MQRDESALKETYKRDLQKRPTNDLKQDAKTHPSPALRSSSASVCKKMNLHLKRPTKGTYRLSIVCIAQRQHSGMQREQNKLKETYERDLQNYTSKETYERDLRKGPTKKTCERDLQTIDCLHCAAATLWYAKRTEYVKRDL